MLIKLLKINEALRISHAYMQESNEKISAQRGLELVLSSESIKTLNSEINAY
ncbi:hypothetical protein NEOC84_000143|nr:hypothetical protein [Neochlamydia sp. AcF84]